MLLGRRRCWDTGTKYQDFGFPHDQLVVVMKLFKIVPNIIQVFAIGQVKLFITSGSLLNEYRILRVFLLAVSKSFEMIL